MMINEAMTSTPYVWIPNTITEALDMKRKLGLKAEFIAGGTLLQLQWEKSGEMPKHLISLENITELTGITECKENELSIRLGALSTLSHCLKNELIKKYAPFLQEALREIGCISVRNRGTIGGNITGVYGDLLPLLVAIDTEIEVFTPKGYERKKIVKWLEERKLNRIYEEIVTAIYLKKQYESTFYQKVGGREAFILSTLTVAGYIEKDKEEIKEVRLVTGYANNETKRLFNCEDWIKKNVKKREDLRLLKEKIRKEFRPYTDAIASGTYRQKLACNIIEEKVHKVLFGEKMKEEGL
ncbi:FAD binding domain-containing protein [Priestia filamentosa]